MEEEDEAEVEAAVADWQNVEVGRDVDDAAVTDADELIVIVNIALSGSVPLCPNKDPSPTLRPVTASEVLVHGP